MQPSLDPVRAYVAGPRDALHVAAADLPDDDARHGTPPQSRRGSRDPFLGLAHFTRRGYQLGPHFMCDAWRTAPALALANAVGTLPRNALAPQADRLRRDTQFPGNP